MELKREVVTPSDHRPAYWWRHCAAFVAVISLFSWWLIHSQPVDTNYTGRITRRYWWDHPLCYETSSSPGWMSQLLPPCHVSYYMHKPYSKFLFFISCGLVPSSFWDRRYSWWSYSSMLPCLLCCPISALPLSYLSYTHLSTLCLAVHGGPGKRKRGRPKRSWLDSTMNDLSESELSGRKRKTMLNEDVWYETSTPHKNGKRSGRGNYGG